MCSLAARHRGRSPMASPRLPGMFVLPLQKQPGDHFQFTTLNTHQAHNKNTWDHEAKPQPTNRAEKQYQNKVINLLNTFQVIILLLNHSYYCDLQQLFSYYGRDLNLQYNFFTHTHAHRPSDRCGAVAQCSNVPTLKCTFTFEWARQ